MVSAGPLGPRSAAGGRWGFTRNPPAVNVRLLPPPLPGCSPGTLPVRLLGRAGEGFARSGKGRFSLQITAPQSSLQPPAPRPPRPHASLPQPLRPRCAARVQAAGPPAPSGPRAPGLTRAPASACTPVPPSVPRAAAHPPSSGPGRVHSSRKPGHPSCLDRPPPRIPVSGITAMHWPRLGLCDISLQPLTAICPSWEPASLPASLPQTDSSRSGRRRMPSKRSWGFAVQSPPRDSPPGLLTESSADSKVHGLTSNPTLGVLPWEWVGTTKSVGRTSSAKFGGCADTRCRGLSPAAPPTALGGTHSQVAGAWTIQASSCSSGGLEG